MLTVAVETKKTVPYLFSFIILFYLRQRSFKNYEYDEKMRVW